MSNYVIILFNGFATPSSRWKYHNNRKLDFLDKLKKIGKIYKFDLPFFTNKFKIEDLDFKNICNKIYNDVKKKYGNNKYILIGHSYGGALAHTFSKLYQKECVMACYIDSPPYLINYIKKYKKNITINPKDILLLDKEKRKELILYISTENAIKYYDRHLYVPTVIFRAYYDNSYIYKKEWNKYADKEIKFLKKDKNLYKYVKFKNADHFIWTHKKHSDMMIKTIKETLIKVLNLQNN
jgi:hypothetical protein